MVIRSHVDFIGLRNRVGASYGECCALVTLQRCKLFGAFDSSFVCMMIAYPLPSPKNTLVGESSSRKRSDVCIMFVNR